MISDEDARYIVGQRAWEDFAKIPDGDCRICGITTSWTDEAGPIHPGCRAITKHGGDRWTVQHRHGL